MTTTTELTPLLKRLKLGAVLNTLPERVALARREQLDYASFLQIILTDEINRRDHRRLELRLQRAGFEQTCRLEDFDWSASITLDRRLLDAAFSLQFLDRNEHVLLVGPVGVGKSFIAQALGYAAVRAGHTPPPRETDLQGIRTEAIGYREPDPPPDIYLVSHSGSRPLDSLHKTFNRDGCRRNQFQVVRHVHIGLAVTDPTRDFHGGRCTSASGL